MLLQGLGLSQALHLNTLRFLLAHSSSHGGPSEWQLCLPTWCHPLATQGANRLAPAPEP